MLCTIPAPSSCAPSPTSQESRCPPTTITLLSLLPVISPITEWVSFCPFIPQLELRIASISCLFSNAFSSLSAVSAPIAMAGILAIPSSYLRVPVCGTSSKLEVKERIITAFPPFLATSEAVDLLYLPASP